MPLKAELRSLIPSFVFVNKWIFEYIIGKQIKTLSVLGEIKFENHEYHFDLIHLNGLGYKKLRGNLFEQFTLSFVHYLFTLFTLIEMITKNLIGNTTN